MKKLLSLILSLAAALAAPTGHAAPAVTATKTDQVIGNTQATPGGTIEYTVIVTNSGPGSATGVTFSDTLVNTTLVPGSLDVSPLARADNYTAVGNTLLEVGVPASGAPAVHVTGSVFDNDVEFLGDTFTFDAITVNVNHGTLTFNNDGTFSYLPDVGYTGSDSFTYRIKDSQGLTSLATVGITVQNRVWYVNNSGSGDGRSPSPFTTLASAQTASSAGDFIYVFTGSGSYPGGIVLKNNQQLIGNFVALVVGGSTLRAAGGAPTIANSAGDGITLASSNNIQGLVVTAPTGKGIAGSSVSGLTIGQVTMQNCQRGLGVTNLLGTSSISNSMVTGSADFNAVIQNTTASNPSGAADQLTVASSLFVNNNATTGADGLFYGGINNANMKLVVAGSTFSKNKSDGLQADAANTAKMDVSISGSTFDTNNIGINISSSQTASMKFNIDGNAIQNATAQLLNVAHASDNGTVQGKIKNNTLTNGANGIRLILEGLGSTGPSGVVEISNNQISNISVGFGIDAQARVGIAALQLTCLNNTIAVPGAFAAAGIKVASGSSTLGSSTVCLNMTGNISVGGAGQPGYRLEQRTNTTFQIQGLTPASGATALQVQTYVSSVNTGTTVVATGGTFIVGYVAGTCSTPAPLMAALGGVESSAPATANGISASEGSMVTSQGVLTAADLDCTVETALERWTAAGLTPRQIAALHELKFRVADLAGWYLAESQPGLVRIDLDAAGNGWFIDSTPQDDVEFDQASSTTRLYTSPQGAPAGRMDLLTTVLHEMGHALGLSDSYSEAAKSSLMYGSLTKGERRLPIKGQAEGAVPGSIVGSHFIGSPISIGTLFAGESVTIKFRVTVDDPLPSGVCQISNQGTVSGSNFADVLTDDPDTGASNDPTITPVPDTTPPTITTCAPAQSAFANASCQASVPDFTGNVVATDNCTPTNALVITQSPAAGTPVGLGPTTVTITVKDAATNASTCMTTFTVIDNTPPSVTCPAPTTGSANASCQAMIPNVLPGVSASDNCTPAGSLTKTQSPSAGTLVGLGSHTITVTVIDGAGNSNQCTTSFSVVDTTPPTAVCSNITVALNASGTATITGANVDGGSTDNCGIASRSVSPSSFTCANLGSNSVTLTVTDTSGNSNQCSAVVTIVDNTPPTITCSSNLTVSTDPGQCTATVSFTTTATDNCPAGMTVICNPPSGSAFPVGVTTVNCTATDASSNPASCNFTVTVLSGLTVVFQAPLSSDTNVAHKFTAGQNVMHKVCLFDCQGNNVTASVASSVSVRLNVTERDSANTSFVVDVPETFSGVGGPGGLMVLNGSQFHYNLQTSGYEPGTVNNTRFFDSRVTVTYNSNPTVTVGESVAILESR